MEEYSITVFYLIDQAAKLEATNRLDDIMVNSVPYMEEKEAKRVISYYEAQGKDANEIIDLDRDENAGGKLKEIFGG